MQMSKMSQVPAVITKFCQQTDQRLVFPATGLEKEEDLSLSLHSVLF